MGKFINRLFKTILGLSLILSLSMVGIFIFVDPNQFKGPLEKIFYRQYGQTLAVQGPLTWTWSPLLALELHEVVLDNALPFKDKMLVAKNIRAELGLASLFTGKVFINLKLKGVNLKLERNAKGLDNWTLLVQKLSNPNKPQAPAEEVDLKAIEEAKASHNAAVSNTAEGGESSSISGTLGTSGSSVSSASSSSSSSAIKVLLSGIRIEEGEISFHDHQKNKHYILDHLNVSAENVMKGLIGHATPVSLSFHLGNATKQAVGRFSLKCDWAHLPLKDEVNFRDISFKFEFPAGKTTTVTGEATILNVSDRPMIQGKVNSPNIDIKPWLDELGIKYDPNLPTAGNISTAFKYSMPYLNLSSFHVQLKDNGNMTGNLKVNLTHVSPNTLQMEGDFLGKQLQYGKIKLDEIKGDILAKEGLIKISPMLIHMAQSVQQCSLHIDLRGQSPKYTFTQSGRGFNLKHLLSMMGVENKIEGKTDLALHLTTSGNNAEELRNNLSGNTSLEISEGKFYGLNLISLLKNAQTGVHTLVDGLKKTPGTHWDSGLSSLQEVWNQKAPSPQAFTPFNQVKATTTLHQGVIKNSDLSITHPEYTVNGSGTINLVTQTVQYQTAVLYKGNAYPASDPFGKYLENMALPVRIEGALGNPMIRPDLKTYTNNALTYAQKNVVEEVIQKNVQKNVEKVVGNALNQFLDKVK